MLTLPSKKCCSRVFDPFGDAGDGEELSVLVELDGGDDGGGGEHVGGVVERGQRMHLAVPGEL